MKIAPFKIEYLDSPMVPDPGWRCAICFEIAQVLMSGETLCVEHAKRYYFGYGDSLISMKKEYDKKMLKLRNR